MKFWTNFQSFTPEMIFLSTLRISFYCWCCSWGEMLKHKTGEIQKWSDRQSSKGCFPFRLFPLDSIRKLSHCVITVPSDTLQHRQTTLLGFNNIWMGISAIHCCCSWRVTGHIFARADFSSIQHSMSVLAVLQAMDCSQHMSHTVALAVPKHSDLSVCFLTLHS